MSELPINTGPMKVLKALRDEAKRSKDWFESNVLTATQLERHGYIALKDYLGSLKVNSKLTNRMLGNIRFRDIADYLEIIGKIEKTECRTIKKLGEVRNEFVHRKKGYNYLIVTRANAEYDPLVTEVIRILEEKVFTPTIFVARE